MGNINKIMGPHLDSILYIIRHILTVGKPDKRRGDYKHLSLIIFRVDWKFFAVKFQQNMACLVDFSSKYEKFNNRREEIFWIEEIVSHLKMFLNKRVNLCTKKYLLRTSLSQVLWKIQRWKQHRPCQKTYFVNGKARLKDKGQMQNQTVDKKTFLNSR